MVAWSFSRAITSTCSCKVKTSCIWARKKLSRSCSNRTRATSLPTSWINSGKSYRFLTPTSKTTGQSEWLVEHRYHFNPRSENTSFLFNFSSVQSIWAAILWQWRASADLHTTLSSLGNGSCLETRHRSVTWSSLEVCRGGKTSFVVLATTWLTREMRSVCWNFSKTLWRQ